MKRSFPLVASALLLFASGARADMISSWADNVQWQYNFTPGSSVLNADTGSGGVSFTNEPTKSASGNSDIVATNLRVFSSAPASSPDHLSSNGAYTLSLTLTNVASGQSGTFTFTGKLGGTLSANNADVTNTFTSPQSQTLALGYYNYTVTIGSYTPPGPPSASNAGSISAHVEITPVAIGPATVPEPSTLLLSCLGLPFLGAAWRKRRAAA